MVKISVCIPTHNRSNYLQYSVNSVLQQTYPDFELIICDDGSTDNTSEIVKSFKDNRLKYIRHNQNIGKSNNMRSGFEKAVGEYFIKFDDDDALTNTFLAKTLAILEDNKQVDFVSTDHWVIDNKNRRNEEATRLNSQKWGRTSLSAGIINNLLYEVFVKQSFQIGATLFRKKVLDEVGFLRPNIQNCEDNDLLVRLALKGKKAYYLPELLMEYRLHPEQDNINRAICYLQDNISYLNNFDFSEQDLEIEKARQTKLGNAKLVLGLRLLEKENNLEGRKLIKEAQEILGSSSRSLLGILLSYLPLNLRQNMLSIFRQLKPQNYADKVRNNAESSV
jgi:glycosyltransferase involved in cell wall biosynthesis